MKMTNENTNYVTEGNSEQLEFVHNIREKETVICDKPTTNHSSGDNLHATLVHNILLFY
jgi:hypothetical protein